MFIQRLLLFQCLKNGMWCIRQKKTIDRKCLRNDSEVTIKVKEDLRSRYAKYVFLLGKNNSVIMSLVLFGPFYRPKWCISLSFHILQLRKSLPIFYTWSLKKVPLSRGKVLGTFRKSQKLILSAKNQCVLVAKISFRKTEKNHQSAKINYRKNLEPRGIPT